MPPKKKDAKKKKKTDQTPDDSTEKLWKTYKKLCNDMQIPIFKPLEQKFDVIREEGGYLREVHVGEEIGSTAVRAVADALRMENYGGIESLRLWRAGAEDEGMRAVAQLLASNNSIRVLEFMDNRITPLGCELLSSSLPKCQSLAFLRLDHNEFGAEGVRQLAVGLSMNSTLRVLSLAYCNIGPEGGQPLTEILIYYQSKLKELNLQGNHLSSAGVVSVLMACRRTKSLSKLSLADNQFGEEPEVLEQLTFLFANKSNLNCYDLRFNAICDVGGRCILDSIKTQKHVHQVLLTERMTKELYTEIASICRSNKPGGKKKKKGKKGKKKK
eukprot:GILJ01003058.1.p1 GENE.GILJ01003058.1~~GILJ01003058.1.p1  ORF type:complete len:328 (+),score=52.41 GILJ01003058.1:56-1039(+)